MDGFRARDLASQLAEYQLPVGSPLLFQREGQFRDYLYLLMGANTPLRRLARVAGGLLAFRVYAELRLMHWQHRVLVIGANDDSDPEAVLSAIRSELESRWHCYFGRSASARVASVYDALSDRERRANFALLVRGGYLLDTPSGFECPRLIGKMRFAALFSLGAFVWLMVVLYAIGSQGRLEGVFAATYVAGASVSCWWLWRTIRTEIREIQATVGAANETLRPRNSAGL